MKRILGISLVAVTVFALTLGAFAQYQGMSQVPARRLDDFPGTPYQGTSPGTQPVASSAMSPATGSNSAISIDPALVGRWVTEDGKVNSDVYVGNMDLLRDGTGVQNYWGISGGTPAGMGGTWRAENGCLYFFNQSGVNSQYTTNVYYYKVTGTTLTLTRGDKGSATLKKR